MESLTPDECRVLGVLIEKSMTTPDLYPLTQNAIVSGSNQKNNRFPVIEMDDDRAFDAAEGLRTKGFAVRVEQSGARVGKYKHVAGEKLQCRPAELALLAELLLRGPQTLGELRGRASRMQAFESIETTGAFLRSMMERPEPLVRRLPPAAGTRAEKYAQLLLPDLHPLDLNAVVAVAGETAAGSESLADRVALLEAEVRTLREAITRLATACGAEDPLG